MMTVRILLGILFLYLFFIVLPTAVVYFLLYGPVKEQRIDEKKLKGTGYETFLSQIREAEKSFREMPMRRITVRSYDGLILSGRFYDNGAVKTAILFHGFRSIPEINFFGCYRDLMESGFNLLIPDERAHYESQGRRITLGVKESEDVIAFVDRIGEMKEGRELLVYGTSMGAGAVGLAADRLDPGKVRCIVLDSGFVSPKEQVERTCRARHLPLLLMSPVDRLLRRIDQRVTLAHSIPEHLRNTKCPVLILHGKADATVPVSDADINYNAVPGEKEKIEVEHADHTLSWPMMSQEEKKCAMDFIMRQFQERK